MKKHFIYCILGVVVVLPHPASADSCTVCADDMYASEPPNCASWTGYCTNATNWQISSCDKCDDGYVRQLATNHNCTNISSVYECVCAGCSDCSSTSWTSAGTGKETRIYAQCNCNTCQKSTQYRCAAGYYRSSGSGSSTVCTRCPSSGGVYGTSAAGSTAITSCYLPSGTTVSFSDSAGSGTAKYTSDCYYTN